GPAEVVAGGGEGRAGGGGGGGGPGPPDHRAVGELLGRLAAGTRRLPPPVRDPAGEAVQGKRRLDRPVKPPTHRPGLPGGGRRTEPGAGPDPPGHAAARGLSGLRSRAAGRSPEGVDRQSALPVGAGRGQGCPAAAVSFPGVRGGIRGLPRIFTGTGRTPGRGREPVAVGTARSQVEWISRTVRAARP